MGLEIERKFLLSSDAWLKGVTGSRMAQGYLSVDPDRTVRVRLAGEEAWITIKGRGEGIARSEFEYSIPSGDAAELLKLAVGSVVDKTRYRVEASGHLWEIDVFHGDNEGLVVAEVELDSTDEEVVLPKWVGEEVSDQRRYFNSSLSRKPFKNW